MAQAPKKPCSAQKCPALLEIGGPSKCPAHRKAKYHAQDTHRGTPAERGYDAAWRHVRLIAFRRDLWCCTACGWEPYCIVLMREVGLQCPPERLILDELRRRHTAPLATDRRWLEGDHVLTIEERPDLRLDSTNVRTLCNWCHSRRTMHDSVRTQ